jgi:CrcB protein
MMPYAYNLAGINSQAPCFPASARDVKVLTMQTISALVFVGFGSMLGGLSRYGMTLATQNMSAFSIPYGTLVSNLAGCLVIGIIAAISGKSELMSSEMRLLLATGFCGGFTTMSSFVYELGQFVQDKEYFYASSYFIATLAGAGIAFALGLLIVEFITR